MLFSYKCALPKATTFAAIPRRDDDDRRGGGRELLRRIGRIVPRTQAKKENKNHQSFLGLDSNRQMDRLFRRRCPLKLMA